MSIEEKMKNAKTTDWLSQGLTKKEIERIGQLAVISAKIQLKRLELGLNQKEFAKMMNVSQGMISRWESGDYNFTIATLTEICDKLDLEFIPTIQEKVVPFQSEDIDKRALSR